jgi:hypothetical protein
MLLFRSISTHDPEYDEGITPEQIRKLCVTFERQNITSLSLCGISKLDDPLFSEITTAFTRMQKLVLSSEQWSVDLVRWALLLIYPV